MSRFEEDVLVAFSPLPVPEQPAIPDDVTVASDLSVEVHPFPFDSTVQPEPSGNNVVVNVPELVPAPIGDGKQDDKPIEGLTFSQALMTSLNYNLGFSVLVFPYHIARTGVLGFLVLVIASFVTWSTAAMIAKMMLKFPQINTYADMGKHAALNLFSGSERAGNLAVLGFRVFQLLELFMYLLFATITVMEALVAIVPSMSEPVAVLITSALIFPMVFATVTPRALSKAGFFGIISFAACYILLATAGIVKLVDVHQNDLHVPAIPLVGAELKRFLGGYGGILLLFAGHAVYPSIFNDLADKKDMMRVVNWTYFLMVSCIICLAFLVLLSYGPTAVKDLPTGFLTPGSIENVVGQVFIIGKMSLGFSPILYPIVGELSLILNNKRINWNRRRMEKAGNVTLPDVIVNSHGTPIGKVSPTWLRLLVGFVVTFFSILIGAFVPSLSFIISLTGALFAVSLALTLPALSFVCIMSAKDFPLNTALAYFLLLFGLASSCLAMYAIF